MADSAPKRREKASDVFDPPSEVAPRGSEPAAAAPTEAPQERSATEQKPRKGPRPRRSNRRRPPRAARPPVDRVMLVHTQNNAVQIAVLEEGSIVEHYVARADDRSLVGNVYLGRVQNVLPGMEASFVDIGESRNGVLYAGEVGIPGDDEEEVPRIETVLRSGQPILVQVTKDPMRSKGARLTASISIAGRHLVLVPRAKSLGVSRRLPDQERTRLREIAQSIRPEEHGLIVRTAAEGASQSDVEKDLKRLQAIWEEIDGKAQRAQAPALVYSEPELELRVIRDVFNRDINRCVVGDVVLEKKLRQYIRTTTPDLDHRLEGYTGRLPIFEEYRVAEQIRKSLDRRVWLPSGGHIVIDRTEAMTVIDVNTGKFVGKSSLEETVFRTNKEAAAEVARQLRLRDIGGIIVIDFIDMENLQNRDEVLRSFKSELDKDRTRTQVFDISPLGLVQMTRKNVSAGIVEAFSDPCPTCEGRGILIHDVD
ncbi:MAG: Rne/Rng family ribonuclease [Actinomycetota bacterium]|nr:Rne/Rng family ribonuclease [Actinomycetota bacterium]